MGIAVLRNSRVHLDNKFYLPPIYSPLISIVATGFFGQGHAARVQPDPTGGLPFPIFTWAHCGLPLSKGVYPQCVCPAEERCSTSAQIANLFFIYFQSSCHCVQVWSVRWCFRYCCWFRDMSVPVLYWPGGSRLLVHYASFTSVSYCTDIILWHQQLHR